MLFWAAIVILAICVIAGLTYAVVRGLQLYREAKRVSGELGAEMDHINAATAKIEVHLRQADEARSRLQEAADRLAGSRAKLDVQLAAVREARAQVRRVFWFVPGI